MMQAYVIMHVALRAPGLTVCLQHLSGIHSLSSAVSLIMVSALQMMTPFQLANIVVKTYPWVPDTGALLNILAAQEDEPSAIELLGFTEGSSTESVAATSL